MNRAVSFFICLLCSTATWSQFVDATMETVIPVITDDPWYGHGVSLVDVNQDGWDDITSCTYANGIYVYENTGTGWIRRNVVPYLGNAKCAVYGDFDRDADLDLFVTYRYAEMRLFRNDGNWEFTDVSESAGILGFPIVATWGVCWEDYNRDGWIDLVVVNYDPTANAFTRCLRNNGDGSFSDEATALGVQGGGTYSFMPCFFKANEDQFNDLFVSVDFLPSDQLFLGNAAGTFSDFSNMSGLNFMVNNMTSSPGDFDQDGDFDLYITNTPGTGSFLYLNNGSAFFSNAPSIVGANINAWTWGANWLDYNNDRNLDLAVASQTNNGLSSLYLLKNEQGAFQDTTPDIFKFIPNSNYAICSGDVNRDGYPDLYLNVEDGGYNRLFRNTENGNNYVKLELQGIQSNANGIGTYIEAFVDGNKLIHQIRGGEQYLSQNSQHVILPLGSYFQMDSLFLNWPSGQRDEYFNLPKNNHYHFVEGNTSPIELVASDLIFCSGSSSQVQATNSNSVIWNTGQVSSSIQINSSADVFGIQADLRNIYWFTDTLHLQEIVVDSVQFEIIPATCLSDSPAQICILSDSVYFQSEAQSCISNLNSGIYSFPILHSGCTDVLVVEIPEIELPAVEFNIEQPTCSNSYLGSISIADSIWQFAENETTQNLLPGNYQFTIQYGWCESEVQASLQPFPLSVQLDTSNWVGAYPFMLVANVSGGIEEYTFQWSNGCTDMNCLITDSGNVGLTVTDASGCVSELSWNAPTHLEELFAMPFTIKDQCIYFNSPESVTIYSITGQKIIDGVLEFFNFHTPGLYFVRLSESHEIPVTYSIKI